MAEALVLGPAIVAFVQLADRIIHICRHYIGSVRDAPHDLRIILVEISSLKAVLQNAQFLDNVDDAIGKSTLKDTLDACKQAVVDLEGLFPKDDSLITQSPDHQAGSLGSPVGMRRVGALVRAWVAIVRPAKSSGQKRQRITPTLATLETLAWPLKAERSKKLLNEISRHKETISLALLAESSQEIKQVKGAVKEVQVALKDVRMRKCCFWLETTNPSDIHLRACALHDKDTGRWVIETKEWKDWINGTSRFVWIYGIPGAGKTLLVSFIISQLAALNSTTPTISTNRPRIATVYYYCYFGHDQNETLPLLGWVISQLCRQTQLVAPAIVTCYDQGLWLSLDQLLEGLADILNLGGFDRVFIVIDAVDECKEPRLSLLRLVQTLVSDPRFDKIQLLASSRDYLDIHSVFSKISVPLTMQLDKVQTDIRKYVYTRMQEDHRFAKWPEGLGREVGDKLAVGAKGMFRWAFCQLDVLRRMIEVDDIRAALEQLPETLDETYERIFAAIPQHERRIAQRALCILAAPPEQRYNDVSDTIAFVSMVFEKWDMPSEVVSFNYETIKDICGCLVTDSPAGMGPGLLNATSLSPFQLAHFTVAEFLFLPRLQHHRNEQVRFFSLNPDIVTLTVLAATMTGALAYEEFSKEAQTVTTQETSRRWDLLWVHGYTALNDWKLSAVVKEGLRDVALSFLRNRSERAHGNRFYMNRLYVSWEAEKKEVDRLIGDVSKW